jgi:hypothetical protein
VVTPLRILIVAALGAALACVPVAAAYTPVAVVATPRIEIQPTASMDYLVYSEARSSRPNIFNLFAKPASATRLRVNPPGTIAFVGSIDGTTLAYAQRTPSGRGQIKLFDLVARTWIDTPAGVNTAAHEGAPSLSGDWLVFSRARQRDLTFPRRLILHHLSDGAQTQLDFGNNAYVQGGGLAGNYVVWTRCPALSRCRTWIYDIAAETKDVLPNPLGKSQFAASVTADGTAYYTESSTINCTTRKIVRFWRQPLVGPRELIGSLPRGRDPAMTSPVVMGDGSVELFFDRFICRTGAADIYKFVIPAP